MQARNECMVRKEKQDGDLVAVTSPEIFALLWKLIPLGVTRIWTGADKQDGSWTWTDGTPWGYEKWDAGQPSDSGPKIMMKKNGFHDATQNSEYSFVCQYLF